LKENQRKHGKKIKADGSEIQIFSFRQSRLFNGLCRESKKRRSTLGSASSLNSPSKLKTSRASASSSARMSIWNPTTAGTIARPSDYRKELSNFSEPQSAAARDQWRGIGADLLGVETSPNPDIGAGADE
jgi:hypothetical protein